MTCRGLTGLGHTVVGLDLRPTDDTGSVAEFVRADVGDAAAVTAAMRGVEAVIHLAATLRSEPFADVVETNIVGTHTVFEAARAERVPRLVYASSNHAVGLTPRTSVAAVDVPVRPDSLYGVSKVYGEALARLYHDRYGIAVACLRIGTYRERPSEVRHLSTWLSPGDLVRLMQAAVTSPSLGFATVYGISANTRGWWDLAPGRELGYEPRDDAEAYAERILAGADPAELDPGHPINATIGGR